MWNCENTVCFCAIPICCEVLRYHIFRSVRVLEEKGQDFLDFHCLVSCSCARIDCSGVLYILIYSCFGSLMVNKSCQFK